MRELGPLLARLQRIERAARCLSDAVGSDDLLASGDDDRLRPLAAEIRALRAALDPDRCPDCGAGRS